MAWYAWVIIVGVVAVIIFILTVLRGNSDRPGVDNAIKREGEFQDNLDDTRRELSEDVDTARDRTSERFDTARKQVRSGNSVTKDSISNTDRLIDKIKKRNGLE